MISEYFLKLDGIVGEATSDRHEGEIPLSSWSFSISKSESAGLSACEDGAGRVSVCEIKCTARVSMATPFLFEFCAKNKPVSAARLSASKTAPPRDDFLIIDLEDVYISSYETGGDQYTDLPLDTFCLVFGRITIDYKKQSKDGASISKGNKSWDRRTDRSGSGVR